MSNPTTKEVNGFDCDGVITVGLYPGPDDVIITGRSFEEKHETYALFGIKNISNQVYFNPLKFEEKTRKTSGEHKAQTILSLLEAGVRVVNFFEDDPIQWTIIEAQCPWVNVVHVVHDLTEKENVRHTV